MHQFNVSKVIAAPVHQVWNLLDDFANTYVYHPIVERSVSVNGQRSGLGARRQCTMYTGQSVQEEVTHHDATERTYTVELIDFGPMPLKHMAVTVSAEATEGGTLVRYSGTFQPKFGPMGWLMAKTMMARQFNKMMAQLLDGVASHLETGRVVGKGGELGGALEPSMLNMA